MCGSLLISFFVSGVIDEVVVVMILWNNISLDSLSLSLYLDNIGSSIGEG
jgi:hypothetical protein